MDGGSAYGIGNTMHVVGITTSASHTPAVVEVSTIYDNVGDVVRISGVSSESYSHHIITTVSHYRNFHRK